GIFTMIFGAVSSLGGVIFITVAAMILWLLGIHGTSVVFVVCMPLYMQVILENGALVAAGQDPVFHPILLVLLHTAIGGAGGTLGLVILGMRSKSAQIKAVSKAGIVPSLFSINEPVTFGMPIVYNPILAIPYILTPVVVIILYWIGYSTGFLVPPYVLILTFMPIGMVDFFGSLSWTNAIFPFLLIPVSLLMYYPFFKIYEKQLLKKEAAVNETVK
ncbi:MAG: PTS transporter subunit EIIC, partial [Lachnospiraceae bacterium]|nr:PTS transporter subunit EIIC [Lachnospiraceae bacterium]